MDSASHSFWRSRQECECGNCFENASILATFYYLHIAVYWRYGTHVSGQTHDWRSLHHVNASFSHCRFRVLILDGLGRRKLGWQVRLGCGLRQDRSANHFQYLHICFCADFRFPTLLYRTSCDEP